MTKSGKVSRRQFIKYSGSAFAAASIVPAAAQTTADSLQQPQQAMPLQYRTLGRTGMRSSILGYGAMRTSDPAVIRRAIDMGINNIDTARVYMEGDNERIVSKGIGDKRKEVYITTKVPVSDSRRMTEDLEASLKALNTDYVDVLLLHGRKSKEQLLDDASRAFINKVQKEGKIRFSGFSTHKNMAELIDVAAEDKFFDVILTSYNFNSDERLQKAVGKAAKAGIGIIAMKTQAGGYESEEMKPATPHQASLRWVWKDSNITCAVPAMVTFAQLEENFAAQQMEFGRRDQQQLHDYAGSVRDRLCRFCDDCAGQCPAQVSVPDINRCLMYAEGYRDYQLAFRNYDQLANSDNLSACDRCSDCKVECKYGVDVDANIDRARELFA